MIRRGVGGLWVASVLALLVTAVWLVGGGDTSKPVAQKLSFGSCAAAASAGYHDLRKGEPGYSARLDGDGDGVACDTKMTFAQCQKSAEYPGGRYAVDYDNGVCTVQRP